MLAPTLPTVQHNGDSEDVAGAVERDLTEFTGLVQEGDEEGVVLEMRQAPQSMLPKADERILRNEVFLLHDVQSIGPGDEHRD